MGCDGGSIPKRDELVRTRKAPEKPDASVQTLAAWRFCALSKQELETPVVACALGKLYNKLAILEFLVDRTTYGDGDIVCGHINSQKDLITLNLTANPAYSPSDKQETAILGSFSGVAASVPRFSCPITQKEMSGKTRFVCLRSCGCVFSELALREVASKACLVCSKPYEADDVMLLNPTTPEDIAVAEQRVARLAAAEAERKRLRKESKKKNGTAAAADDASSNVTKDKKRKAEKEESSETTASAKRSAPATQNINMRLPDLSSVLNAKRNESEVIKSIYVKKDKNGKSLEKEGNFLVRATANRYAAGC
eukprot:jgi/Hompol1/6751/HPOL_002334-RA